MDKDVLDLFIDEVYTMIQTRYRFMERRWWMIVDGKWTRHGARDSLEAQIHALAWNTTLRGKTKEVIQSNVGKTYINDRIIARLGTKLHAWDGLPARSEPIDPKS